MSLDVRLVRYGPNAFAALAHAVGAAKGGDPLQLVTVVVPRGPVGLAARRRLAAAPGGICNVRHITLARLAADLAVPWLAATGKRPRTRALEHEAVRAVLATHATGILATVRDQPATVQAVARTARELETASSRTLDALARRSPRSGEVVEVVRSVWARLGDRYGDAELLVAAVGELGRLADPGAATGPVVVHLPPRLGTAALGLVRALAGVVNVTILVGLTGRPSADRPAWAMAELLGAVAPSPDPAPDPAHDPATRTASSTPDPEPTALATEVWAAPSADAEVLIALRRLSTLHREGTPLERMALLHSGSAPYPRLVEDALVASGMPFNGPGTRPLSATVAGRTLLGFLELAERGWRRDDLMAWLSGAPLLHRGRPAPAAAWDLLSCDARVIVGLEEWRDRLAAHATVLRRRAAWLDERDADPDDGAGIAPPSLRREADACEELWHFVEGLADRTAAVPDRWAAWGRWCRHLLDELLGGPAARASWPTAEVAALDTVVDALGGLAALDEVDRRPALADVRAALESELEVAAPQTSRFGHGILCGRLEDAVGCDFDVVWVLGMMDGAFPASATDDVLVPDRDRELVADETELPRRASRRAEAERDLLAALAGPAVRILSYSVGDQRQGGELRPARPLLDALGELAGGRRLYAKDLPLAGLAAQAAAGRSFAVPSFAAAATGAGTPASADDWDLRSMARWVDDGHRPTGHFRAAEDSVLARGLALRRARRSNRLTRFDGRVDVPTPSPAAAPRHEVQPVAPTALERYARCPRQHLLATVLGLSPRERPEEVFRISPLDRGMAVHRVLERYVAGEILRSAASEVPARPLLAGDAAGPQLGSPQLGSPVATVADAGHVDPDPARVDAADEARLLHLAAEVFAELEEQRLTGRDALWEIDRATIVTSLRQFLVGDREHRRHRGAVPVAVEERFGAGDGSAVVVDLGGGRRIAFGGRIDRVDRTGDGGVFVLDYKSGRPAESEGPMPDPLSRGARLQLAVYGLAARQHYRPEGRTAAGYWYLGGDGALAWCELSPELEGTLVNTLRVVTEAIDRGAFPARPGDPDHRGRGKNCSTCAFDAVCPADRHREWQRKRSDPWIADYVALAEPGDAVVGDAEPGDAEPGR